METSNCAAPISSYSPAPSPTPGLGRGPASQCPRPPAECAPATPRPRLPGALQGRRTGGPGAVQPGRSSPQLGAGLQPALLHARSWTRAGTPHPGPTTAVPSGTPGPRTPRLPARATGGDGQPEGGRDRGTKDGRPLPTWVRASVAPAQPSRRSPAPSSARPAAAHARHPGRRHPPTRGRPRAAPAAGRADLTAAGAGEREPARRGHRAGQKREGSRAWGTGGCGARVWGGRQEREMWDRCARRGRARSQDVGRGRRWAAKRGRWERAGEAFI